MAIMMGRTLVPTRGMTIRGPGKRIMNRIGEREKMPVRSRAYSSLPILIINTGGLLCILNHGSGDKGPRSSGESGLSSHLTQPGK
jgi:hypothetical protein